MIPVVILTGPTAVGKTELALSLAAKLDTEIISADSMQVYKTMDIGTAKPSREQQLQVKHHLIDLVGPDQDFSVADYQENFEKVVRELQHRGKIPLLVGGTGLYIRAATRSFPFQATGGPQLELRNQLREEAEQSGPQVLHQRLQGVDPQAASRIHPNDLHRVIRALEVFYTAGAPLSTLARPESESVPKYRTIYIFIDRARSELYQRIEQRVDSMIAAGLVDEVAGLLAQGYRPELKSMQSLGYKQITAYLKDEVPLQTAVSQMKQLTRNYAKRQLTWFRKEPVDLWIDISEKESEFFGEILNYIEGRLKNLSNTYC